MKSLIFETYKNGVSPHVFHIYKIESETAMATFCTLTSAHHVFTHWKRVLRCCEKCPIIIIPSQESNGDTTNICTTISFKVYRNLSRSKLHGICP